MSKDFPLTLAGRTFATHDELHEAAKDILHTRPLYEDLTKDYPFLRELINQHPNSKEKIGVGIRAFQIEQVRRGRSFRLYRINGKSTDFSYLKCVQAISPWSYIQKAFRVAVDPQVIAYRRDKFRGVLTVPCAVTGKMVTAAECEVDHAAPVTFTAMLKSFLEMKGLTSEDITIAKSCDNQIGCRLGDKKLQAEWRDYHLEHAVLRIVETKKHREQSAEDRKGVKGAAPKRAMP